MKYETHKFQIYFFIAQHPDKKKIPKISLKILKALQKESENQSMKILNWTSVLRIVRKRVKNGSVIRGCDIFSMCYSLKDLGLVSETLMVFCKSICSFDFV